MNFRCGQTQVTTGAYGMIATMVSTRRIRVSSEVVVNSHGAPVGGAAFYAAHDSRGNARADTFYLPRISLGAGNSLPDLTGRALLIHEATHAIQDSQAGQTRADLPRVIAETAAYVAQALYYRLCGETFQARSLELRRQRESAGRPMSAASRTAGDRLLAAVEPVAERLLAAGGGAVHDDEYERIKQALFGHPVYAGHAYEPAGFDGIGGHHAP
jgi:hypothetical protein